MDPTIEKALNRGGIIDITTTGRKTGSPHRLEIAFHNLNGKIYISGLPGRRDWYANVVANPEFVFHLKRRVKEDLPARARPIRDETERRALLSELTRAWGRERHLDRFMRDSPLIEVTFQDERRS
ncbi:MAG: nitroreductase/quinone reductase family protein [Anaerolineales bacterium]